MAFTEESRAKVREYLAELLAKSQGKWIAVSDFSFSTLATKLSLDRRYAGYAITTLKEMNALEVTGIKRWTRFRTLVTWIDVDKVIEQCEFMHELNLEEEKNKKKGKNDNKPLFVKDTNMKEEVTPPKVLNGNKFHPMESKVFTVRNNKIFEGMVVGISPSPEGYRHQLQFDAKKPINPDEEIEYFSYYVLFPNVKALMVTLEKNITRYKH